MIFNRHFRNIDDAAANLNLELGPGYDLDGLAQEVFDWREDEDDDGELRAGFVCNMEPDEFHQFARGHLLDDGRG